MFLLHVFEKSITFNFEILNLLDLWFMKGAENKHYKERHSLLTEEESQFQSLVLTSNYWIWEVDKNGIYTFCSPTVYEILGYQPEEVLGKTPFDFIIPEGRKQIETFFQNALVNCEPIISLENSNRRKDGKIVILETNGVPFYNNTGELLGYRGIDRNITRRIEGELKLRNEQMRLKILLETIPDMIWLKDIEGTYLSCNPRFEKFFGAKESEIIGKTDYDFVSKELADFFREKDRAALKANSPSVNLEWVTFSDDGHKELLETIKAPIHDANGNVTGILGIARDVTKYKQAEDALHISQSRLELAMDMAKLGIWEYEEGNDEIIADDRFFSLYGTSRNELSESLKIVDFNNRFIHPDDRQMVSEKVSEAISSNKSSLSIEHRILLKDGEVRYLRALFLFIKDENGKTVKTYGVNQDITAMKKAEFELKELNASKDKFFSIIAHDLKNPFNTIIGFSEVLKDELKSMDDDAIKNYAGLINTSAVQTFRLLENLLEWANSQLGKILFNPGYFNLSDIVAEEFLNLNDLAMGKGIELNNSLPVDLLILADVNMIKTIMRNLLTNAIKFTHRNGKVEVSATADNTHIEISVSDSGIGMTPVIIDKIFRLDGNLSTRGTEDEKGTGLGLILCKEFVEKHGGKIWVESEPGKGSEFKFTLPVNLVP
jgi:PAS domain S-box-containing protein